MVGYLSVWGGFTVVDSKNVGDGRLLQYVVLVFVDVLLPNSYSDVFI